MLQVSGWRVFNGIDEAGLWEVWLATVVSFGLGTDVGHVIEVRGWGAGLKDPRAQAQAWD